MTRRAIPTLIAVCALLGLPGAASAQPDVLPPGHPPLGPADVIGGARQALDEAEMQGSVEAGDAAGAQLPPGHPPTGAGGTGGDRQVLDRVFGRGQTLATATPSRSVPPGTIQVTVVNEAGQPVSGANVRVGIMRGEGARDAVTGETDASGVYTASDLDTGSAAAYRVTVPFEGAVYGATPFRLEPDQGYRVRIMRLPTTDDPQVLLQIMGQTMLEFRDERLHVVQQTQIANLGNATYVFPADGQEIRLPEDFKAFQSQQGMGDQRLVPTDRGFSIRGSIPPGRAELVWAYDVPLSRAAMVLSQSVPWRTYQYRVVSEAAPGMDLDVTGFPPAEVVNDGERRLLVTQVARTPQDPVLDRLEIRLGGIPGPGPWRWIAVGGAIILFFAGLLLLTRDAGRDQVVRRARVDKKRELLEEAAEVERLYADQEVGPKYRSRRLAEIEAEIAAILRLEEAAEAAASPKRA